MDTGASGGLDRAHRQLPLRLRHHGRVRGRGALGAAPPGPGGRHRRPHARHLPVRRAGRCAGAAPRRALVPLPGCDPGRGRPGRGQARRGVAVRAAAGLALVGPDNGLLAPAIEVLGGAGQAVELSPVRCRGPTPPAPTFDGRDLFAPVAAHLCRGGMPDLLGPELDPGSLTASPLRRPFHSVGDDGAPVLEAEVWWMTASGTPSSTPTPGDLGPLLEAAEQAEPAVVGAAPVLRLDGDDRSRRRGGELRRGAGRARGHRPRLAGPPGAGGRPRFGRRAALAARGRRGPPPQLVSPAPPGRRPQPGFAATPRGGRSWGRAPRNHHRARRPARAILGAAVLQLVFLAN